MSNTIAQIMFKYVILTNLLISTVITQNLNDVNFYQSIENLNGTLSGKCLQDYQKYNSSSAAFWKMVDSSSKIPSGMAEGNIFPMGNYDECLNIEEVETKFCIGNVVGTIPLFDFKQIHVVGVPQTNFTVPINFYFCVYDSCTTNDLNIIFEGMVEFSDNNQCLTKAGTDIDASAIVSILVFAAIGLITVLSTGYDLYLTYINSESKNLLFVSFSLYTNGKKLFQLGNNQQLQCLNGLKSLSMLWVVLGHVYMGFVLTPLDNYVDVYKWLNSTYSQYITGATVSVDTFFVIGGFLTIYTFESSMSKGTKFNVLLYYFHRFLRLTPALAAMVLAHATIFTYFGSGPFWNRADTLLADGCRKYWWSALLYVQNYANPNGICVPQSWYLSVDMQLYLISPLFLILMHRWPQVGYITISILSMLSMIASFLLSWFFELSGQLTSNTMSSLSDYMKYYYMPTHTRMTPYLFGIMLGYYLYHNQENKKFLKIKNYFVLMAWIISLALMAICIYGGHTVQFTKYDRLANAFFIALMRPTWALAICWIIFACTMNCGGIINYFLSLPIFQFISRICYSIYLVHYSFIFLTNFDVKTSQHFSDYNAFHKFCGDFTFTVVIAITWTLIFESPIIVLEKLLFRKSAKRSTKSKIDI